jgi:hypothetical protein
VTCRDLQTAETAQALLEAASGDPYGLDPDGDRVACNGAAPGGATTDPGADAGAASGTRAGGGRGTGGGAGDAGNAAPDAGTVPTSGAAAAPPPTPGLAATGATDCRIFVQTERAFAGVDCADAGATAGHLPPGVGNLVGLGPAIMSRVQTAAARAEAAARAKAGGGATARANGGGSTDNGGTATSNANGGAIATGTVSRGETDQSSSGRRSSAAGPATSAQRVHGDTHRHRGSERRRRHKRDGRP